MATVNPNDERLQKYENTKNSLINEAQSNYNKVSGQAEEKYNELIQASKDYGQQQAEITQAQTDQTIAEINQNKEQAEKDYIKEQKAGYADYAKQTNAYGVNAEAQASAGLQGSGYSESSKVSMYNTYQNRYATARESYNQAVLNYNNQITQAQLQNSAQLAEIAYNSLQTQLSLAIEGFKYENELLNNLLNQKISISTSYDSLWQSQYSTLLNEAQFNEQMAYQRERDAVSDSQWQQQFNLAKTSASSSSGRSSGSSSKSSGSSKLTNGSSGDSKLSDGGSSSAVDELYKSINASRKEPSTNIAKQMQYQAWKQSAITYIQQQYKKGVISADDVATLISRLGLS